MAEEDSSQVGVFDSCFFAVIRGGKIDDEAAAAIVSNIQLHGGECITDGYPKERLEFGEINYVISETFDFPDYFEAIDRYIPVVTYGWITTSIANGRLAHPRKFSPDSHLLMSDVVATCADLPAGDKDAIAGGVLAMGGNYSSKLTSSCTHLIALSLENEKAEQILKNQLRIQIVLPHWFDDCLKLGRRIDEGPYLLPDPEILKGPGDRVPLPTLSGRLVGADSATPAGNDMLSMGGRKSIQVFNNKYVFLDSDLQIGDTLRNILEEMVLASNGKIVNKVSAANMVVCKYRDSENFKEAVYKRLEVGNLAWLYYLIVHDVWTSPFRRLLHFPLPREPLPGFEKYKIALSNYSGEARTYLENLILATGAEGTKTLKSDNTHLVTAHRKSEKVIAAEEWGVKVVNHLWIEECYSKWQEQSVTTPRYQQFPKKTNLGDVVGHTQIDRQVIETKFLGRKLAIPATSTHPASFDNGVSSSSDDGNKHASSPSRTNAPNKPAQTPSTVRKLADKDMAAPSSVASRRSKAAASAKLSDMTSDIALYEKERKRVGGVVYGGRKKDDTDQVETGRKRSAEPADTITEPKKASKKQRTGPAPITIHLMISGYAAWVGHAKREDEDTKKLRELGIAVVTHPSKASHLAVPKIVRTPKFLVALAHSLPIITADYIQACLDAEEGLDPANFKLSDKEGEASFGVSLQKALKNAKKNEQKLLQEYAIYSVEKIQGGFDTFKAIVEVNGGSLTPFRGRSMAIPKRRSEEEEDEDVFLLSNGTDEEKRLWPKFVKLAEDSRRTGHILTPEWLLRTALRQEVQPIAEYEHKLV